MSRLAPILLLLLFWALALAALDRSPPVFEDEPIIASHAWTLAREGRFGSDLMAGFFGVERRTYEFLPLYPLLQAPLLAGGGLGLFQIRLVSVMIGLVVLALTIAVGRRLGDPWMGLIAGWLMVVARLAGESAVRPTGIHLFDTARIGRYDILVPAFGLAAFALYLKARTPQRYTLAGLLAGLAGLSHLYGLFWLPALLVLAAVERRGARTLLALGVGFALPWFGYALYVLSDLEAWRGQIRIFAPPARFSPLDWRWYATNLLSEPRRYGPGLDPGWRALLRPALWSALLTIPPALVWLTRQTRGRRLIVPLLVMPPLYALLIQPKLAAYLTMLVPLVALAVAWWGRAHWRTGGRGTRVALALLLVAVTIEGAGSILRNARAPLPRHAEIATTLGTALPPGRVLALHRLWIGLERREVRSWALPILQGTPGYYEPLLELDVALDRLDPDVVLIDPRMRAYFADHPRQASAWQQWRSEQGLERLNVLELGGGYGRIELYARPNSQE